MSRLSRMKTQLYPKIWVNKCFKPSHLSRPAGNSDVFSLTFAAQFTLHFIGDLRRIAFTEASHKSREIHQICDPEKRAFLPEHHLWIQDHKVGPLPWNGANRLFVHLQQQPPTVPVVSLAEANQLSPAERMERMRYPDKMRRWGDIACILN